MPQKSYIAICLMGLASNIHSVPFFRTDHERVTQAIISVAPLEQLTRPNNVTWTSPAHVGHYANNAPLLTIIGGLVEPKYDQGENNVTRINEVYRSSKYGCPVGQKFGYTRGLALTYDPPDGIGHWVAMVCDGRCMAREKIKVAYNAGATGVIIYQPSSEYRNLRQVNYRRRNFSVVRIDFATYQNISTSAQPMAVKITPGKTHYPLHIGSLILLCFVLFILSLVLICYGRPANFGLS